MAAPSSKPIAMRPEGPIQLLSNAYLRKSDTATIRARMPSRLNQPPPITDSRSRDGCWGLDVDVENAGGRGGIGPGVEGMAALLAASGCSGALAGGGGESDA